MFLSETSSTNKPFKIINLRSNLNLTEIDDQQNYGLLPGIDPDYPAYLLNIASKADVNSATLNFSWDIIDPSTNALYEYNDQNFAGFTIDLLDKNNNYVQNLTSNLPTASFYLDSAILKNISLSFYNDINYLRNVRLKITSKTLDSKLSNAYYVLSFPISEFSNVSPQLSNGLFVNYNVSERNTLRSVTLQNAYDANFTETYKSITKDVSSSIYINNDGVDKLFYRLLNNDYYNTGVSYNIGQVKLNNLDTTTFDLKPSNLSGAISIIYNSDVKDYEKKLFVKWSPTFTNSPLNYEIHVTTSGTKNVSDIYYLQAPKIENINYITQGTGFDLLDSTQININPYYSGTGYLSIFSPYGQSGIQWTDHTLVLDKKGSFPSGIYSDYIINDLFSITIPSGNINSNKAYLTYFFDTGENNFIVYTGSTGVASFDTQHSTIIADYYSEPYEVSLNQEISGIKYLNNTISVLVAERFEFQNPNQSIVVSDFEPYYFIPFDIPKNYEVSIRSVLNQNIYTDYSDSIFFSSSIIYNTLTGVYNLKTIDGTGISGYLAKFNGSNSLTTGTLYYDVSNKLNFSELPDTTSSPSLYSLVVEGSEVKRKIITGGAGSGSTLMNQFTQASHGFSIGDILRFDGSTWSKALAVSPAQAEVQGVVQSVSTNSFELVYNGLVTGLSGLTAGTVYFLSPTTAGTWQDTEPSNYNEISKPVFFALTSTSGNVLSLRGYEIQPQSGTSGTSGTSGSSGTSGAGITGATLETSTPENGRTFLGWLPVDIGGTTRYIRVYQ